MAVSASCALTVSQKNSYWRALMLCLALAKRESLFEDWRVEDGLLVFFIFFFTKKTKTHKLWCLVHKSEQPSWKEDKTKAITKKINRSGPTWREVQSCTKLARQSQRQLKLCSQWNKHQVKFCMQTASFTKNPSSFSYFHSRKINTITFHSSRTLVISTVHSSRILTPDAVIRPCAGKFKARAVTGFSAAPLGLWHTGINSAKVRDSVVENHCRVSGAHQATPGHGELHLHRQKKL